MAEPFALEPIKALKNASGMVKIVSGASEVARRASELARQVSELARRLWRFWRVFKLAEAVSGLDAAQLQARIAQLGLANISLALDELITVLVPSHSFSKEILIITVEVLEGLKELLEELNAIPGSQYHLLTNNSLTPLQNLNEWRSGPQKFGWRIASSADSLNSLLSALSSEIEAKLKQMAEGRPDRETWIVAAWLSPFDFFEAHNAIHSTHLPDSGQWLLQSDAFQSWLTGRGKCLALYGGPGSGKTVLTSIVVEYLRSNYDHTTGLAWVYLNFRDETHQTLSRILGSLLQQLIWRQSKVSSSARTLYEEHEAGKSWPDTIALEQLLQTEISTYAKTFIIVDGLDGASTAVRFKLPHILQSLDVNLFISSRSLTDIVVELREAIRVDMLAPSSDMKDCIRDELSRVTLVSRLSANDGSLRAIIDKIEEKSNGSFVSAQLMIRALKTKTTLHALRQELDTLPTALEELYDRALAAVVAQPQETVDLAIKVIFWVYHARRALSLAELQHALAVGTGDTNIDFEKIPDKDSLLLVCGGLVVADRDTDALRFPHHTAREHLANSDYVPKDEADIATTCLDYLLLGVFSSGACESKELLETRLEKFPFLAYAAQQWGEHVRSNERVTPILSKAFDFLRDDAKVACAYEVLNTSSTTIHEGYIKWPDKLNSGLHLAAYFGLHSIIERYLEDGYDLEVIDDNGQTPLSWAVESQRVEATQLLIDHRKSSNKESQDQGRVPILWAIQKGNRDMVLLLLRFEDQKNWRDSRGWGPLLLAVQKEDDVIVKHLIEAGAELNPNIQDWTPLSLAAARGHERNVKLLLDLHIQDRDQSALLWAAAKGHKGVVTMLMDRDDVQPESRDDSGRTALSWAAGNGNLQVVRSLLESGKVDPSSKDDDELTPLAWAAADEHYAVVDLLMEFGADW